MNLGRLRLTVTFLLLAMFALAQPAEARSFMAFLRAVGNSIAHPQHSAKPKPTPRTGKRDASNSGKTNPSQQTQPVQQSGAAPTGNEVQQPEPPPVAPTPAPTVIPEPTVRAASAPPGLGKTRRDIPYAVPVPNKSGFVTSPFAPKAGLVDVRGFPSGTEVKDPYTGKVFLTP